MACFDNDVVLFDAFDGSTRAFELSSYMNASYFWDDVSYHLGNRSNISIVSIDSPMKMLQWANGNADIAIGYYYELRDLQYAYEFLASGKKLSLDLALSWGYSYHSMFNIEAITLFRKLITFHCSHNMKLKEIVAKMGEAQYFSELETESIARVIIELDDYGVPSIKDKLALEAYLLEISGIEIDN